MAAASSCASSRVPTSKSEHRVGCAAHRSVEAGTWKAWKHNFVVSRIAGRGPKRELLRITCEETFLRRQRRRLLHGIFAATHGEDADAVECSPEVEVASGLAPTGLHLSRAHYLPF